MRGAIAAAAALGWLATTAPAAAAAQIGCFSDGDFVFLHVGNIYQYYVDKGDPRVDCTPDAVRIGLELTEDEARSLCAQKASLCQEKKNDVKLIRETYADLLQQSGYVSTGPIEDSQGQAATAQDATNKSAATNPELDLDSRDTIRFVQKSLQRLGYNTGGADGAVGKRTAAAIRKYEKDNGMRVTGKVSKALIASLQKKAGQP
jgi:hypothetical protein